MRKRLILDEALLEIAEFWRIGGANHYRAEMISIAGTEHDQLVPDGISNPYWELVRRMPSASFGYGSPEPESYTIGLSVTSDEVVGTYSWGIPSPGDLAWIVDLLEGQGVVEVGAGNGYWAYMLDQYGVDVVAYEPNAPADNAGYVCSGEPYFPLLGEDSSAAGKHPDRALLISWPSYGEPWAATAIKAYKGDLLIYVGETARGNCADDEFFDILREEWVLVGESLHHRSWRSQHCNLLAYRRI